MTVSAEDCSASPTLGVWLPGSQHCSCEVKDLIFTEEFRSSWRFVELMECVKAPAHVSLQLRDVIDVVALRGRKTFESLLRSVQGVGGGLTA